MKIVNNNNIIKEKETLRQWSPNFLALGTSFNFPEKTVFHR